MITIICDVCKKKMDNHSNYAEENDVCGVKDICLSCRLELDKIVEDENKKRTKNIRRKVVALTEKKKNEINE